MKKLNLLLILLLFSSVSVYPQTRVGVTKDKPGQPASTAADNNTNYYKYQRNTEVVQSIGKTYTANELQNIPATDINRVANTVGGVQSRSGETPSIRGADPSGTAYYVDGVRVYGALPILMK